MVVVVVVGQDGLIPNVAAAGWLEVRDGRSFRVQRRSMAMAQREDGQSLLALNEVFVGHRTHRSARYRLRIDGREKRQSSSGIICATGTGSTGWARSIARQRHREVSLQPEESRLADDIEADQLEFVTGQRVTITLARQQLNLVI